MEDAAGLKLFLPDILSSTKYFDFSNYITMIHLEVESLSNVEISQLVIAWVKLSECFIIIILHNAQCYEKLPTFLETTLTSSGLHEHHKCLSIIYSGMLYILKYILLSV